jgi:hypothetical protein
MLHDGRTFTEGLPTTKLEDWKEVRRGLSLSHRFLVTSSNEVREMVISRRPCEEAEVVCNKAEVPCVGDGQKTLDCIGTRCGGREDDSSTKWEAFSRYVLQMNLRLTYLDVRISYHIQRRGRNGTRQITVGTCKWTALRS